TTRVLAENRDASEAMRPLLGGISEAVGWDAAGFWFWNPATLSLQHLDFWAGPKVPDESFRGACQEFNFEPGEGLPGQVWAGRSPVWIEELGSASNFHRLTALSGLGLRSAFAFPVCVGADCIGVMEF